MAEFINFETEAEVVGLESRKEDEEVIIFLQVLLLMIKK